MKVSELEGAELDYWVAKAVKHRVATVTKDEFIRGYWQNYMPSTYWSQGGPIIEREGICVDYYPALFRDQPGWAAFIAPYDGRQMVRVDAPTPLIAAMRCYVASKFGDEVSEEPAG